MKYSVVLQDPFDYARMWLLIGLGLILAAGAAGAGIGLISVKNK